MRSETTQRVITASVLVVVSVSVISYSPALLAAILMTGLIGLVAWEWTHLAMLSDARARVLYSVVTALLAAGVMYSNSGEHGTTVLLIGCIWWLIAAILLYRHQTGGWHASCHTPTLLVLGWLLVLPATGALASLFLADRQVLLFYMVLIWIADSAAYFGGRRWGRHKLATRISPGKTWEGFAVAVTAVITTSVAFALARGNGAGGAILLGMLGAICAVASVVGDLFISLIKRNAKLKDSGALLPGHGGIWDRIDGVTAAAPLFAILWFSAGGFL